MRIAIALATALLAFPAWASDFPKGYESIGKYELSVNDAPLNLISVTSAADEYSDLYFTTGEGAAGGTVTSYTVQATSGLKEYGEGKPPIFSVEFDLDPKSNTLVPVRVMLVDQTWDAPLATYPYDNRKSIRVENFVFRNNGKISFDITANLTRLNWETGQPVQGSDRVKVQGHYSGKFPKFFLENQRIFGDY